MSRKNGDADLQASALYGFSVMLSAMLHAIRAGKMKAVPCFPDGRENTVSIKGQHFRLESVEPGTLSAILDDEPEVMARTAETMEKAEGVINLAENLVKENRALRAALHPFEETTMIARRDPATNELQSTYSIKRLG